MDGRFLLCGLMAGTCSTHDHLCWQAVMLIVLTIIAGCHARRPDFMTRVQADCAAGDQWACDLVNARSRSTPEEDIKTQDNVKDDVDAILRGIDRARTAPRVGYPDVPPITGELPTLVMITKFPLKPHQPSWRSHWLANLALAATFVTLDSSVAYRWPNLLSRSASVYPVSTSGRPTGFDHVMPT